MEMNISNLTITGWSQANSAHNFLNEIEKFEHEA
jgi:hypothetical protein